MTDSGQPDKIFVGRHGEMAELKAALDSSMSGQGRMVMLAGEPGIGKTRTATELAEYAENQGAQVHWGWCYEGEGAPPYWPWVQAIRSYAGQHDAAQMRTEMGPGAADIAEMVPELRVMLPDLEAPATLDPDQARFRLFDSTTAFLMNAAESQPMVLVLDDLHWADQPSLLLLEFLARQMAGHPLLVLGCYRDVELSRQHPLSETLAQLSREPMFQRRILRGLSQDDTERFLEAATGARLGERTVEAVYAQTEGNPFFMSEIIRLWSEQGDLTREGITGDESIRIPEGVREVIGRRLNRLSSGCNEMLTTASVVGREFGFRLLSSLSGTASENELIEALEEALAARIVEELPGSAERYQFTHALIQETLSGELSAARRVRLHARIGEALEELYGADAENHATELAHHFAQAEPVLGPKKLVRYSLLAGEQALAGYAYEAAFANFQQALEAKGIPLSGSAPAPDSEAAALLFGLGRAQVATLQRHQLGEAVTSLARAFDYYVGEGDVERAITVAGIPLTTAPGTLTGVTRLVAQALQLVPPASLEAGNLLTRHGRVLGIEEGNYEAAHEALEGALAIARRENDVSLEMWTLANAAQVEMYHLHNDESLECGLKATELARQIGDLHGEVVARYWTLLSLRNKGEVGQAREQAPAILEPAERLRDRYWLVSAYDINLTLALVVGDWETARAFSDRALALAPLEPRILPRRAVVEFHTGAFQQGEAFLERFLEALRLTPTGPNLACAYAACFIPNVARTTGTMDWFDLAKEAANTVVTSPTATPLYAMYARLGLALATVQRNDKSAAAECYALARHFGGKIVPSMITADRILGLLSGAIGNPDQAAKHFEDALAFCRRAGYRPELAWTCHDYADCLLAGNSSVDRQRAMSLLDESMDISTELGMRPLMERVAALRVQIESGPEPAPAYPDGLTQREVEVLRLIAVGKSSRDVAEELVLSIRTVERHITNIYGKINARGRADATAYALGHSLVEHL